MKNLIYRIIFLATGILTGVWGLDAEKPGHESHGKKETKHIEVKPEVKRAEKTLDEIRKDENSSRGRKEVEKKDNNQVIIRGQTGESRHEQHAGQKGAKVTGQNETIKEPSRNTLIKRQGTTKRENVKQDKTGKR
jgi:hypothetical protein